MPYDFSEFSILWLKSAHKNLRDLPHLDQKSIIKKIDLLPSNHKNLDIKKIKGYSNMYRLRIGDYRVIFSVKTQSKQICIAILGHRKDIYTIMIN